MSLTTDCGNSSEPNVTATDAPHPDEAETSSFSMDMEHLQFQCPYIYALWRAGAKPEVPLETASPRPTGRAVVDAKFRVRCGDDFHEVVVTKKGRILLRNHPAAWQRFWASIPLPNDFDPSFTADGLFPCRCEEVLQAWRATAAAGAFSKSPLPVSTNMRKVIRPWMTRVKRRHEFQRAGGQDDLELPLVQRPNVFARLLERLLPSSGHFKAGIRCVVRRSDPGTSAVPNQESGSYELYLVDRPDGYHGKIARTWYSSLFQAGEGFFEGSLVLRTHGDHPNLLPGEPFQVECCVAQPVASGRTHYFTQWVRVYRENGLLHRVPEVS